MSFSDCITAYANSERIVKWGAVGHPVAFPELAAFDEARRRLVHKIQDNAMHESWDDGLKLFNTIHAKLARTPCRPDWLIREILDTRGGRRAIEGMEGRLSNVDPGVRDAFSDLKVRLDVLGSVETSPLLEPLKDSRMSSGTTLFVLRDLRIFEVQLISGPKFG